jgi:hypothetical protein
VTVIASERPTCCLIRNLAGTYDTGYIGPPEKDAVVAAQQRWLIASL